MKKILPATAIIFCTFFSGMAQHDHSNHNNATVASDANKTNISQLLDVYYNIKDALVAGNANIAAIKAVEFLKALNGIDMQKMSESDHNAFMPLQDKLILDAKQISEAKDVKIQRDHFATFSTNMAVLAKAVELTEQPVYEQYCPMKKTYWLSSEAAVRNPYYGKAMLTCGKVVGTIKR